jgi:hypothetical protein
MTRNNSYYPYETLTLKSDEELKKIFLNVRSTIYKLRRKRQSTKNLEVEYCYIQKELQDRRTKRISKKTRAK